MHVRLLAALLVLCGLTAFAPAPMPRRAKSDSNAVSLRRMTGDWRVVSMWRYGPNGQIAYHIDAWSEIRIRDGQWQFVYAVEGSKPAPLYDLVIGSRQPATIDFVRPGEKQAWMSGIVRFRNDKLEVLYQPHAKDRPTSFENPPDGYFLFTLTKTK
jgi:uncharacterized protein (TIGR03067 family)